MKKTILVRRTNSNTQKLGQHCTLTNAKNDVGSVFAFGMTDDGDEVYIPAAVVRSAGITEADVGAGFTCPLKTNARAIADGNAAPWVAINPVVWDDDSPETMVVDVDGVDEGVDVTAWDDLVAACAEMTDTLGPMDELVKFAGKLSAGAQHLESMVVKQRGTIRDLQLKLDELAPEVNE